MITYRQTVFLFCTTKDVWKDERKETEFINRR